METEIKCSLCGLKSNSNLNVDTISYDCKRCGHVMISRELYLEIHKFEYDEKRHLLSGVARYWKDNKLTPIPMMRYNVDELIQLYFVPHTVSQRVATLINFFGKFSDFAGEDINFQVFFDYPIAFCKNHQEFDYLLKYLESNGVIERISEGSSYALTVYGWSKFEELKKINTESNQAFVAMWFDKSMHDVFDNYICKALTDCKYDIMRIDMKEHNNKIDDEIIAEIRKSKFMIADFTGHRGGVYFEAGFALGLDIPVIWTCKKTDLKETHFDTRQFNYIDWESGDDLHKRLVNRINASIIR